jgi:hypothetical protein
LPSNTPTPTLTATPGNGITWAPGTVTLSDALRDEIGDLLTTNPPIEASGNVYAITNISGNDAAWNVSIANIIGLSAPYDTWNIENDANWSWFVECTGTEPNWSCHYYTLPSMGGGNTLRLPWKSGYYAIYGVAGVHSGAIMIPDSMGIDLFGSDSDNGSMPPLVVAAGDGTITSVCSDSQTMAIRVDGGPVPLGYFHFDIGQDFQEGQRISQGDVLGSLKHGTFSGTRCGWANQRSDQYHIHFVFKETSSGYFSIGGCVLDINTQNFVCNGSTYGTLSKIPNGGEPSPPGGTPDPDAPPGYKTSEGGPHIWDGIVDAIIKLNSNTLSKYLPNQNPTIKYAIEKVNLLLQSVIGIFLLFMTFGISASVILIIIIAVISQELTYRGLVLLFGAGKTILPFLKYI